MAEILDTKMKMRNKFALKISKMLPILGKLYLRMPAARCFAAMVSAPAEVVISVRPRALNVLVP